MSGSVNGGKKVAATLKARDPDYYAKIGAKGGKASGTGGFYYAMINGYNWHRVAGRKGGTISRKKGPNKASLRSDNEGTPDHPDVTDRRS